MGNLKLEQASGKFILYFFKIDQESNRTLLLLKMHVSFNFFRLLIEPISSFVKLFPRMKFLAHNKKLPFPT